MYDKLEDYPRETVVDIYFHGVPINVAPTAWQLLFFAFTVYLRADILSVAYNKKVMCVTLVGRLVYKKDKLVCVADSVRYTWNVCKITVVEKTRRRKF